MEPLDRLDKDSILEERIFQELFDQEDEIKKARLMIALADRAEELGVKTKFNTILRAYKKVDREMQKKSPSLVENWTNFIGPYDNMKCGLWIASDQGIYAQKDGGLEDVACYHPILPVERLLSGLVSNAPQIISQAGAMLVDFIATIASHLPEILQKGIEIIGQLLAGIIRETPSLIAAIPGIIADIGSAFLDKDWVGIGWDIISGIGSGIASAAGNLVDAAVSAAKDAVDAVKGWLGIASPSKLMRDEVGRYMALGVGVGFERNVPTGDMTDSISGAIGQMQSKVSSITTRPTDAKVYPLSPGKDNSGGSPEPFDYDRMGKATARAMEGMGVYMNSKSVGKLVTPVVNDELGRIGRKKT